MNSVDMLDRALEGHVDDAPAAIRALVVVAREVAGALTSQRLSRSDQDRIYARSLALLEEAVQDNSRGWQRVLHLARPAPVVVGGAAALTIGVAAIGWAVLHGRRSHGALAAGLGASGAVPLTSP